MKVYVCGFLFDRNLDNVLLVQKNRPEWQRFLMNGIGGHAEKDETPLAAMRREFTEETTIKIVSWNHFCTEIGSDYVVHFFKAAVSGRPVVPSANDSNEALSWQDARLPAMLNYVGNLHWLIPLALDWRRMEPIVVTVLDNITERPSW